MLKEIRKRWRTVKQNGKGRLKNDEGKFLIKAGEK